MVGCFGYRVLSLFVCLHPVCLFVLVFVFCFVVVLCVCVCLFVLAFVLCCCLPGCFLFAFLFDGWLCLASFVAFVMVAFSFCLEVAAPLGRSLSCGTCVNIC